MKTGKRKLLYLVVLTVLSVSLVSSTDLQNIEDITGLNSVIDVQDRIDMNGNDIHGLANPDGGGDAVPRSYADGRYLRRDGNNYMNGNLDMNGNNINSANQIQVDSIDLTGGFETGGIDFNKEEIHGLEGINSDGDALHIRNANINLNGYSIQNADWSTANDLNSGGGISDFSNAGDLNSGGSISDFSAANDLNSGGTVTDFSNANDLKSSGDIADGNVENAELANDGISVNGGTDILGGSANLGGSLTVDHADTSNQGNVGTSGGTVIEGIDMDGRGHLTNVDTRNIDERYENVYSNSADAGQGWYRIAKGDARMSGEFTLKDTSCCGHSSINFRVGASYGDNSGGDGLSFTLLQNAIHQDTVFQKVRVVRNGTYDEKYLEVWVEPRNGDGDTQPVEYQMKDQEGSNQWTPVDWKTGNVPSGYSVHEYDITNTMFAVGSDDDLFNVGRDGEVNVFKGQLNMNGNTITNADWSNANDLNSGGGISDFSNANDLDGNGNVQWGDANDLNSNGGISDFSNANDLDGSGNIADFSAGNDLDSSGNVNHGLGATLNDGSSANQNIDMSNNNLNNVNNIDMADSDGYIGAGGSNQLEFENGGLEIGTGLIIGANGPPSSGLDMGNNNIVNIGGLQGCGANEFVNGNGNCETDTDTDTTLSETEVEQFVFDTDNDEGGMNVGGNVDVSGYIESDNYVDLRSTNTNEDQMVAHRLYTEGPNINNDFFGVKTKNGWTYLTTGRTYESNYFLRGGEDYRTEFGGAVEIPSGNLDMSNNNINNVNQLGDVDSTAHVANLNADQVDGHDIGNICEADGTDCPSFNDYHDLTDVLNDGNNANQNIDMDNNNVEDLHRIGDPGQNNYIDFTQSSSWLEVQDQSGSREQIVTEDTYIDNGGGFWMTDNNLVHIDANNGLSGGGTSGLTDPVDISVAWEDANGLNSNGQVVNTECSGNDYLAGDGSCNADSYAADNQGLADVLSYDNTANHQVITDLGGGTASINGGDIRFQPASSGGTAGLSFQSNYNSGSDGGWVTWYDDNNNYNYWGDSSENGALVMGTTNDGQKSTSDVTVLKSPAAAVIDSQELRLEGTTSLVDGDGNACGANQFINGNGNCETDTDTDNQGLADVLSNSNDAGGAVISNSGGIHFDPDSNGNEWQVSGVGPESNNLVLWKSTNGADDVQIGHPLVGSQDLTITGNIKGRDKSQVDISDELDMNGNNIVGIGGLQNCGNNQYVDGNGNCDTDSTEDHQDLAETVSDGNSINSGQTIDASSGAFRLPTGADAY